MEDPCAQTLEALEEFIHTQRTLLARTQSDIERLRVLKHDVVDDPEDFISNLEDRLDDPAFRLSGQPDCGLSFPKKIRWGAFIGHDLSPLEQLHSRLRDANTRRIHPSKTQTSELSDLQRLVKNARKTIIDPVLIQFPPLSDDEDEVVDPEVLRRQREHEKIRELKKMKIRTRGLKLPSRAMATTGVFIRHDVEDESMDVDISVPEQESTSVSSNIPESSAGAAEPAVKMEVCDPEFLGTAVTAPSFDDGDDADIPIDTAPQTVLKSPNPPMPSGSRSRRSTRNGPASSSVSDTSRPLKRTRVEIDPAPENRKKKMKGKLTPSPAPTTSSASPPPHPHTGGKSSQAITAVAGKPKPETYKQAWSVAEQHLLEQLLDEIPEGEKFRWQKISRAMGGKRTPRQVASRVQKYFEKLKRFGVG